MYMHMLIIGIFSVFKKVLKQTNKKPQSCSILKAQSYRNDAKVFRKPYLLQL